MVYEFNYPINIQLFNLTDNFTTTIYVTDRIEWIALAVAVNLAGSRVLLESRPARSVLF